MPASSIAPSSTSSWMASLHVVHRQLSQVPHHLLELTADAATHTDEQISVALEKDAGLPVAWSVTPSNDPATATAYSGTLADNGGTIQITSAGTYDIAASVTDATGRVFTAPSVSVMVYPVAGLDFTLPAAAWTDSSICIVSERYFTKQVQFYDINYQLAQNEDKNLIFENWCDFLNYFDSSIRIQFSFLNQPADMEEQRQSIHIPDQKDAFNSIRVEYSDMLKGQLSKGNNGLTKTKYITFGVEADSLKEAKPRLERKMLQVGVSLDHCAAAIRASSSASCASKAVIWVSNRSFSWENSRLMSTKPASERMPFTLSMYIPDTLGTFGGPLPVCGLGFGQTLLLPLHVVVKLHIPL